MKQIYLHSLILFLLILQSCAFEPKGEAFVTVDPTGQMPNIQINLNLSVDTLYIPKNKSIIFAYGLNGAEVNWAKFIINGKETDLTTFSSNNVELTQTFNDATGKIVPLEMQIFTKSKTGSIADKIGAEGYLISKKWTIKVMEYYQLASNISKVEFVDGTLKLEWTKYKGFGFTNYKVYKEIYYGSKRLTLVATINSIDQTSVVDNTYHGEPSHYYILTNDMFQGSSTSASGPIPDISSLTTMTGDFLIKWTKPPFYKNLKGYRISIGDKNGGKQQLAEIYNSAAESYLFPNPIFANDYMLYLTLLPLSDNYLDEMNTSTFLTSDVFANYGLNSPKYNLARAGLAPITYLQNDNPDEGILVFDQQKMTVTRHIKCAPGIYQFDVSANNKYLVGNLILYHKIYFENLTDTTKSKKIDLTVSFPLLGQNISVSNLGTGVLLNGQNAVLYDYINELKLAEIKLQYSADHGNKISPSGNFFFCQTYGCEYYQYKDNQIIRLQESNPSGDNLTYVDYLPGNSEKLIRAFPDKIEVVDCNTWVIEKRWQFPNGITQFYNLDKKSGKALFREKNKLILFDVNTGMVEELKDIGGVSTYYNLWTLFYNNGMVLWSEGKAMM